MDVQMSHPDGVDPLIGKIFDERYRIEEPLGEGGIGRVYKARHATLGKLVALKVLLTRYESIPVLKQRFQREAEALAALSHPNIVTVTDYGVAEGHHPYIVMELLEGQDLNRILETGEPLEPKRALNIVRQMLRALAYAHSQGLVHRDLKPHNVFVRSLGAGDDHVEVLDFGLARFVNDAYKDAPKLTAQGALLGTPAYMAPEQARGEDADARADVYAAGCVLYEALTGRRVFESPDPGEILRSHLLSPPPTLKQGDPGLEVDPALEALFRRCLEKDPAARYTNAGELLEAFDGLGPEPAHRTTSRPTVSRPASGIAPTQGATAPTAAATPAARRELAETAPSVELPQRRAPLFLLAGCGALVLMGLGAGGVYFYVMQQRADDPPPPPDTVVVDPVPAPPPAPPTPTAPLGPPAAHDPFEGDAPQLLMTVYETIESRGGSAITRRQQSELTAFQSAHPDDPRPHVLFGHIHIDARPPRFELGIGEYRMAVEADARVRGDPQMLPRVLDAVRDERMSAEASDFLVETWGEEALPVVQAELRERMPEAERARVERLVPRLGGASGGEGVENPWQ
ncbi:MAG: protein kinase [Sandaracinaceae bacterium]